MAEQQHPKEYNPLPCAHDRVEDCATRLVCRDCGASGYMNAQLPGVHLGVVLGFRIGAGRWPWSGKP